MAAKDPPRHRSQGEVTVQVVPFRWVDLSPDANPKDSLPSELGYVGNNNVAQVVMVEGHYMQIRVWKRVKGQQLELTASCRGMARARRTAEVLYASLSLNVIE